MYRVFNKTSRCIWVGGKPIKPKQSDTFDRLTEQMKNAQRNNFIAVVKVEEITVQPEVQEETQVDIQEEVQVEAEIEPKEETVKKATRSTRKKKTNKEGEQE